MNSIVEKKSNDYSSKLSFECNAPEKTIHRIKAHSDAERSEVIIDNFVKYFGNGIRSNPTAFRDRFRIMAVTTFNFYRGSAILFYQDLKIDQDQWIFSHPPAGNMFIYGDLHAENFETYLDKGIINFDMDDFDEGYCGPFTWDVKRLLASLNLVTYSKGFSDKEIESILQVCAESYLKQICEFRKISNENFQLTLKNTTGKIKKLLNEKKQKLICIKLS